ncbi:MAG TPA: CheR family methyltransferase, partial [Bryobacteraceae bacterium]|nr:CheR family methyltransferase [Bryobacteraceae bacterium]
IWVPGCSTGEEVYSIAIALMEHLGPNAEHVSAQIFGTDISDMALDTARSGIYSEAIVQNVSGERLRRFFTKLNPGYRINKRIREMCIFAKQNVAKDPPFSRLHLISCRNVLIYLDSFLQKRIIPSFHYALQPSGFLLLGASESIGVYAELFSQVDKKHKIYLQKPHSSRPSLEFHVSEPAPAATPRRASVEWTEMDVREADKILLAKYAPPGVVIDEHLNILQFRGPVSPFLQPAGGPASLNLMRMAPDEIQREVRNAMHRAQAENRPVRREVLKLRQNGKSIREIGLEVIPFKTAHTGEPRFLIVFEETPRKVVPLVEAAPRKRKGKALSLEVERENQHLRQEIAANKDYLQSIIDAQEASNEELRSASEEIQSTNEELQSTNEELETAKEEMQSTNEELYTVNEELENRNLQLSQAGNDLVNLLNNILIPIVMLGSDLRIRRFTPVCEKVLNLIPSDIGRPINDIKFKLEVPDIEQLLLEVLQTLEPRVKEVRDLRGHPYSMRLRPYRTEDNRIDGVVLALIDMDPGGTVAQEQVAADPRWQSGQNRLAALLDGDDKLRGNKESIRSLATGLLQAQEDERRRISRELHDDLNQKLALLHVNVERMEAKAPRGSASIRSNLKLFREAVSDLSDSIRRIAYHLHPSMLDDLGLVAAAQSFCEDFSESENIQVTFQHENIPGSVPQDVSLCVYRILQEALRNIAKHAHSKRAMVALEGDASFLRLTVKDAGTGFNRDDLKRRHGLGLLGMQERVRLVGGELSIDSHPGEGTRVEVQVPLGQAPQIGPAAMTNEENVS